MYCVILSNFHERTVDSGSLKSFQNPRIISKKNSIQHFSVISKTLNELTVFVKELISSLAGSLKFSYFLRTVIIYKN